jgi:DeoR/GlpR family transcriptional regulator of sugar metabolism
MSDKRMPKNIYPAERRQEIAKRINDCERASVAELAGQFGVSEVTIRADLQALAARNLIVRTHGGAVAAGRGLRELSLADRTQQQVSEKDRIGAAGAALVSNDNAVILDASSTALAIARHLKHRRELTLLTNSIAIAHEMLDAPGVTVVMPGGTLRRDMASLTGGNGLEPLRGFNIQKGFFGAHGLSLPEGLTDVSLPEAETKRKLVAMCRQVFGVVDSTKWGRFGLASFAAPEVITCVITDAQAPADLVEQVRALGIKVTLV